MRARTIATCGLTMASLAVAGCGGSGPSTSASAAAAAKKSTFTPSLEYVTHLSGHTGSPAGAPAGAGVAIIAFHDAVHEVCWRFAHLHGFTGATTAGLGRGRAGQTGHALAALSTGPLLHHRGCIVVSPATMTAIAADPKGYYVAIDSRAYPRGAVRAQL
jgi:hypothetical protein